MEKVRWGLVGAGDIANKRVAPAIKAENRSILSAVVDTDKTRAEQITRDFNCPKIYQGLEQVLADKEIDAIYVATPVFLHAAQVVAALKAGKHVLCEKPLALNYQQALEAAEAEKSTGKKAGVAYFRRFYPKYLQAKEMLKTDSFGKVILIRMAYHSWVEITPESPKYWRMVKEKSGGGVLSDMGCHMFDVMLGLFGLPEWVFAKTETMTFPYEVEDSAVMVLKYRSGPQVTASFHWNSKTWTHEFEIIGTEAKVKWWPYDSPKVIKTVGRDIQELELPNHENVHLPLIADFVSAIIENRLPAVSLAEAAKTNLMLDAVSLSSREARPVHLSELAPGR